LQLRSLPDRVKLGKGPHLVNRDLLMEFFLSFQKIIGLGQDGLGLFTI
jgi:hypothetical protein